MSVGFVGRCLFKDFCINRLLTVRPFKDCYEKLNILQSNSLLDKARAVRSRMLTVSLIWQLPKEVVKTLLMQDGSKMKPGSQLPK